MDARCFHRHRLIYPSVANMWQRAHMLTSGVHKCLLYYSTKRKGMVWFLSLKREVTKLLSFRGRNEKKEKSYPDQLCEMTRRRVKYLVFDNSVSKKRPFFPLAFPCPTQELSITSLFCPEPDLIRLAGSSLDLSLILCGLRQDSVSPSASVYPCVEWTVWAGRSQGSLSVP